MIRTEPTIAVHNVEASSKWYQSLLDCKNTHTNGIGSIFDQLVDTEGTILLGLHHWGDHHHPLAGHNEFTLRDLDGYYITICSIPS